MKTADVKAALRARFIAPEWAIFFEVGDGTGSSQRRWADAVAMNMWPSRGLEIHGFEIKVSRSDWLREIKDPAKSAKVQQYCDRWWIITPKGIIKPGELPPTWGNYEVSDSGVIRQVVAAPQLESVAINRSFMAAMLRRAGGVDEEQVASMVRTAVEKARAGDKEQVAREIEARSRHDADLREKVKRFEEISELSISKWGEAEETAKAVQFVLEVGAAKTYGGLTRLASEAETFAKKVRDFTAEGAAGDKQAALQGDAA
jgi:hypothetical protein